MHRIADVETCLVASQPVPNLPLAEYCSRPKFAPNKVSDTAPVDAPFVTRTLETVGTSTPNDDGKDAVVPCELRMTFRLVPTPAGTLHTTLDVDTNFEDSHEEPPTRTFMVPPTRPKFEPESVIVAEPVAAPLPGETWEMPDEEYEKTFDVEPSTVATLAEKESPDPKPAGTLHTIDDEETKLVDSQAVSPNRPATELLYDPKLDPVTVDLPPPATLLLAGPMRTTTGIANENTFDTDPERPTAEAIMLNESPTPRGALHNTLDVDT